MDHGSLFTGIGGFDLAAQWVGWNNVFQVENDDYCTKVLEKNFPNVRRYKDIRDFNGSEYRGRIDIVSGGFPCQPFSHAGKRGGESDNRFLWPEMLRIISEIKPAFVVGENVAGIASMEDGRTLEGICTDLENEGYRIELYNIPACGVGAWHKRERIWIVAYAGYNGNKNGLELRTDSTKTGRKEYTRAKSGRYGSDASDTNKPGLQSSACNKFRSIQEKERTSTGCEPGRTITEGWSYWKTEPKVGRMADGIPNRVDRIKGLGNAIVPQVAYEIFKAIDSVK